MSSEDPAMPREKYLLFGALVLLLMCITTEPAATATPSRIMLPLIQVPGLRVQNSAVWKVEPNANGTHAWIITGEIRNELPHTSYEVQVTATFYDPDMQAIKTVKIVAYSWGIFPGERRPFRLLGCGIPDTTQQVLLSAEGTPVPPYGPERLPFTVLSQEVELSPYIPFTHIITGTVRNDQKFSLEPVEMLATFYDEQGRVVGVGRGGLFANGLLAPGETMTYEMGAVVRDEYTHVTVQGEGMIRFPLATVPPEPQTSMPYCRGDVPFHVDP
jgi:hypothetical protein